MAGSYDAFLDGGATPAPPAPATGAYDAFLDQTPQMSGLKREVALPASATLKGLASFFDKLVPAPSSDPYTGMSAALQLGDAAGVAPDLASQAARGIKVGGAGLIDRPDLQPQTERERVEDAAFKSLGGSLPFLPVGGWPGVAPLVAGGLASGAGSYEGEKIGGELGHPLIGSLVGGAAGGLLGAATGNVVTKTGNALLGNFDEMGNAYRAAGVPMRMTGDVSENPTLQHLQAYSSRALGGSGRTQAAARDVVNGYERSVEATASDFGTSRSLQDAGAALQDHGRQWLTDFRTASRNAWNAVDAQIPGHTPVPLDNYVGALTDITSALPNAPETARVLQSALPRNLADALQSDVGRASLQGATLPWQTVKGLRTRIGEMLSDPNLPTDVGRGELKRLYAGLSQDMQGVPAAIDAANVAAGQPATATAAFQNATALTRNGHDFIDNVLTPIVREGQTPEGAARSALSSAGSGGTTIAAIRQQMPDAANELAAFKLRDMAQANPGAQNAAGTLVSPSTFLSDWHRLSTEAQDALFPAGAARTRIDALRTISQGVRETGQLVNHSNSAVQATVPHMLEMGTLWGGGGYAAGGPLAGAAGFAAGAGALPTINRGLSYIAANRPLAAILAARGAPGIISQIGALGASNALLGRREENPRLLGEAMQ